MRIDLESDKGIRKGLPQLLDLFKKREIKGSFYLTMGGESGIFSLLSNSGKMQNAGERKIKAFSLVEKLRIAFLPKDFVSSNKEILQRIIDEGHELGIHGWKHRTWTRNFEELDKDKDLNLAINKFEKLFRKKPESFSAPGFMMNGEVTKLLERKGITHISDFNQDKKIGKVKNVAINTLGQNRMPFVEYWVGEGKSDKEILGLFREEIEKKEFVSFYLHGLYEGIEKISLLESMLKELKKKGFTSKRIIDIK